MKRKTGSSLQVCEYTGYDEGCIESARLWVVPYTQVYK